MKKVSICLTCKFITTKRFCPRCCYNTNSTTNPSFITATPSSTQLSDDSSEKSSKKVLTTSICPGCGVLAQNKKFAGTHGNRCVPYGAWKNNSNCSKNPFTSVVAQTLLSHNLILFKEENDLCNTEKLSKILQAQIDPDFHQFKDKIDKIAHILAMEIVSIKTEGKGSMIQKQTTPFSLSRLLALEEETRSRSDSSSTQITTTTTPSMTPSFFSHATSCNSSILDESSIPDSDETNFLENLSSNGTYKMVESSTLSYHPYRKPLNKNQSEIGSIPKSYRKLLHFLEDEEQNETTQQSPPHLATRMQNSSPTWFTSTLSPSRIEDEMPQLKLYQNISTSVTSVYDVVKTTLFHFKTALQKIKDLPQQSKEIQLEEMKFFQPELGNEMLEQKIDQDRDYFLRTVRNPIQAVHYFANWLNYFFQQQEYGNAIRCCLEIGCCLAKQYSNNLGTLLSLFSLQTLIQQQQSLNWSSWVEDENMLLFAAEIFFMVHSLQEMSATNKRLSTTSLNNSETFRTLHRFCTKQDSLSNTLERIKKLYRKPTVIDSQRSVRFIAVDDFEMVELGLMFDHLLELSNQQEMMKTVNGWVTPQQTPNLSPLQSASQSFYSYSNSRNSLEPASPVDMGSVGYNSTCIKFSISSESEEDLIKEGKQRFLLDFR